MVSSYTPRNRLNKQGTGDNTNIWGEVLNAQVFDLVDASLDGWSSVAVSANTTLTSSNGASDQSRARALKFTGAGGYTVTLPAVEKWYIAWNAASANVIVSVGGANTVTLEPSDRLLVLTDGVGVYGLALGGLALKAYIDSAVLAATGSLPATTGNEGKSLFVRSGVWTPDAMDTADLTDYATNVKGLAVALAVAL